MKPYQLKTNERLVAVQEPFDNTKNPDKWPPAEVYTEYYSFIYGWRRFGQPIVSFRGVNALDKAKAYVKAAKKVEK